MKTIIFVNRRLKELKDQPIDLNGSYGKKIYEDGELKCLFWYEKGEIEGGSLVLDTFDDLDAAKSEWLKDGQNWSFYWTISNVDGIHVRGSEIYRNGNLFEKNREVIIDDKLIAIESRDLMNDNVIFTEKYYYDDEYIDSESGGLLIKVQYIPKFDDMDIITQMDPMAEYTLEEYQDIDDFTSVFNFDDHPYYLKATPLIPEGKL